MIFLCVYLLRLEYFFIKNTCEVQDFVKNYMFVLLNERFYLCNLNVQ